ncbi:MAG: hypothetical protein U5N85_06690 [Arcicella sp.]|nr:hypothetical protein [Arcicella sp.]
MTKKEIKEKQANFEAWVATLDERIFDWLMKMTKEQKRLFDYSIESLDEVEKYLTGKYELEDLSDGSNKFDIDGAASYVYSVFMKHLPNYQCLIELKDKRSLLFNIPAINTNPRIGVDFSPYFFLLRIINLKRIGDFRFKIEIMIKDFLEEYGDRE